MWRAGTFRRADRLPSNRSATTEDGKVPPSVHKMLAALSIRRVLIRVVGEGTT